VPLNSASGVLGFAPRRKASIAKVWLAPYDKGCPEGNGDLFGYPLHPACWRLIQRVIGPDSEQQLEALMKALRQRFDELFLGPIQKLYAEPDGTPEVEDTEDLKSEDDEVTEGV
jgi:hypothetical protein